MSRKRRPSSSAARATRGCCRASPTPRSTRSWRPAPTMRESRCTRSTPAYTSVIGQYKFARRYGLSVHQAAACAIGRRGTRLAERPTPRMGDHVAFLLPARNRGKHVWSFWGQVARRAAAHRARGRPGHEGPILAGTDSGDSRGTARRAIRSSAAGEIPARESSAESFGGRLWAVTQVHRNRNRNGSSKGLAAIKVN